MTLAVDCWAKDTAITEPTGEINSSKLFCGRERSTDIEERAQRRARRSELKGIGEKYLYVLMEKDFRGDTG